MEKHVAVILSAGKGKRMQSDIPKQYIKIGNRPLICYTLDTFEKSFMDEIILVVGPGEQEYIYHEILKDGHYNKISQIIEGGAERYDSVYNALRAIGQADYVYIHDGARPCVTVELLERAKTMVEEKKTAIAAVRTKDTIKIVDADGKIKATPDRNTLWQIQTPQAFWYQDILCAYQRMTEGLNSINITDDAMVMETYGNKEVFIFEGDYRNIKVTTPEDLILAEKFLEKKY